MINLNKKSFLAVCFSILSFAASEAALAKRISVPTSNRYEDLFNVIQEYRSNCPDNDLVQTCAKSFSQDLLYTVNNPLSAKLPQDVIQQLEKIAFEQAQIWGDTILEGDYVSAGDTRIFKILGIFKNQQIVGFRITYAETAWYTGDCNYDERVPGSLEQCQRGHIEESSFVSPDLKTVLTDENNYADFK